MKIVRDRARAFADFCDGMEDVGYVDYARRGRVVADALVRALDALEAERSARVELQGRCETLQEIVGKRAYDACVGRPS
jgi:hypothetical protein